MNRGSLGNSARPSHHLTLSLVVKVRAPWIGGEQRAAPRVERLKTAWPDGESNILPKVRNRRINLPAE